MRFGNYCSNRVLERYGLKWEIEMVMVMKFTSIVAMKPGSPDSLT